MRSKCQTQCSGFWNLNLCLNTGKFTKLFKQVIFKLQKLLGSPTQELSDMNIHHIWNISNKVTGTQPTQASMETNKIMNPHSWILLQELITTHLIKKFPAFHETSRFLAVPKNLPLDPILNQMNPVNTLTYQVFKLHSIIIYYPPESILCSFKWCPFRSAT
jgi:hypothetical protein